MKKRFYTLVELIIAVVMIGIALAVVAGIGVLGYVGYHFLMKIW